MKKLLILFSLFLIPMIMQAQDLDVDGTAKIATMNVDNIADSLVVKTASGMLGLRLASTLPDLDNQTLSYNPNGELSISGGNTVSILDGDWLNVGGSAPTISGDIYHTGDVSIGHIGPAFGRLDVYGSGASAIRAQNINAPTNGYLAVIGAGDFDGITGLSINGLEIGAMGVSVGGSNTDNVGVYGFSNWWGGAFVHSVSGHRIGLAGTNYPIQIKDANIADATNQVLIAQTADGEATWGSVGTLAGWETDDIGEVNLVNDSAEVHIGVDWGGPIGDKLWVRALDPNQNPLRVQIAPGTTRLWVASNGGTVFGTASSTVKPNSIRVYQDGTFGEVYGNARLTLSNTNGIDRDTMVHVKQNSSNTTGTHYGVRVDNNPSTTSPAYGFYHARTSGANGTRYGYYTTMSGGTGSRFGVRSQINNAAGNASSTYGIYSAVTSGATTGFSAAGYFNSSIVNSNEWSVYSVGNNYFSKKVGIGTTTLDQELTVYTSSGTCYIRVADNTAGPTSGLRMGMSGSGNAYIINDETLSLSFGTDGTTQMRINSDGEVAINDLVPAQTLHVKQHVANKGIRTEDHDTSNYWETGVGTTTKNYKFYYNNLFRADISSVDGSYTQSSDRRLKKDISKLGPVLSSVMSLNPVTYRYIDGPENASKSTGFIAQEVENHFPQLVREGDDGYKGLVYDGFTVLAIKAVQEQQAEIEALKKENEELKKRLEAIEAKLVQ